MARTGDSPLHSALHLGASSLVVVMGAGLGVADLLRSTATLLGADLVRSVRRTLWRGRR